MESPRKISLAKHWPVLWGKIYIFILETAFHSSVFVLIHFLSIICFRFISFSSCAHFRTLYFPRLFHVQFLIHTTWHYWINYTSTYYSASLEVFRSWSRYPVINLKWDESKVRMIKSFASLMILSIMTYWITRSPPENFSSSIEEFSSTITSSLI